MTSERTSTWAERTRDTIMLVLFASLVAIACSCIVLAFVDIARARGNPPRVNRSLLCERAGGVYLEGYCLDVRQIPLDGGGR